MNHMRFEGISDVIVNESDNLIYVSDIDTYDVIFLNKALKNLLGIGDEFQGGKCYKLLQGRDEPCPFCTNSLLNKEEFYIWKHSNEFLKLHQQLKDKLIEVNGKMYRMEIAVDNTAAEKQRQMLETQLLTEETLVGCIQTLSENIHIDTAINKLLQIIGEFYRAERAYIFEIDYLEQTVSNSYEWCTHETEPQIEKLKNIPISAIERWLQLFYEKLEVCIDSLPENVAKDSLEYQILMPQGIESLMATPMWENGEIIGFIGVDNPTYSKNEMKLLRSITYFIKNDLEKRALLKRLEELGYKDALTELGNRNKYIDEIEELQRNQPQSLGVIFVDINGLKKANDQYGHKYGDRMIQNVAEGVRRNFSEKSYRIGGDEFVALLIDADKEEFARRLDKLRKFEKEECICDFSLGVSFNEGQVNIKEQIENSDDMMYMEKKVYYKRSSKGKNNYHEALARELMEEIESGMFEIYLQPKVQLNTEQLVGAEALVRKRDEQGTVLLPNHFIPLYEAEGIIQYLDMYVFEQVCRMLCEWELRGYRLIPISVNFSRGSLMGMDVVGRMTKIRNSYHIASEYLKIEVLENINKTDLNALAKVMKQFNEEGFALSLDDYGVMGPNNSFLTKMDFKEIKIDKSLVDDIVENKRARLLLDYSVQLGKELGGMSTVAEGIESVEQLDILKEYGALIGQGYVFSKPMPIEEFVEKYAEKYLKKE